MTLTSAQKDFIQKNKNKPLAEVALKLPAENRNFILDQINGLQKIGRKVPSWEGKDILFPPKVSLEQCSSEATARYKAELVGGENLLDGTGGFGTDTYFMSEKFSRADYFELNADLCEIVRRNFSILDRNNVAFHNADSTAFLRKANKHYDWIYLDPARRDAAAKKVFLIEDCTPDVKANLDLLLAKADNILVKLSPIMDIKAVAEQLPGVWQFWVTAVKNEVKELLFHLRKEKISIENIKITCVDFKSESGEERDVFTGTLGDLSIHAPLGKPQNYLYEPGKAILKAGLQDKAAREFALLKLDTHSNFFTSATLHENYPGRVFEISDSIKPKQIRKFLQDGKANIISRNYPLNAARIYEKFKIKPGGSRYLLATALAGGEKVILVGERLR